MKIIDAHSHIDYISHKIQPNVVGTVVCATKESEWNNLIDIGHQDDRVYCAFGIHPWFIDMVDMGYESRLEQLLKTDSNYMVGEIGIDKNHLDMDRQIDIFTRQFDVAIKMQRNVFVHCVGAWDKMLHILKQYKKSDLPIIIFHGFMGDENVVKHLIKNYGDKIYFSFGKNALYGENRRITQIDYNKILVESDGKFDSNLVDVMNKIIDLKNNKNIPEIIYNNTQRVLHHE